MNEFAPKTTDVPGLSRSFAYFLNPKINALLEFKIYSKINTHLWMKQLTLVVFFKKKSESMPSLLISQNEQKNPPWPHVHFVSNADETVFCISNLIRTLEFCLQHSDRRKCIPCVVAWSLNLHLQRIARPALRVVGGRLAKVGERYCSTVQRVVSDFLRWGSTRLFVVLYFYFLKEIFCFDYRNYFLYIWSSYQLSYHIFYLTISNYHLLSSFLLSSSSFPFIFSLFALLQ